MEAAQLGGAGAAPAFGSPAAASPFGQTPAPAAAASPFGAPAPAALALIHQLGAVLAWVVILRARFAAQYPLAQSVRG